MRKRLWDAFCIFLFACLIAGLGYAITIAQENQPPTHAQGAEKTHAEDFPKCEERSFWERSQCDPVAAYTGLLALFTAVLIGVSGFQIYFLNRADVTSRRSAIAARRAAIAAGRTVKTMEDTAERQLRAYVLVTAVRIENIGGGNAPEAIVTIKNCGQTPAYELTQWSNMGLDLFPHSIDPPMRDRPDDKMGKHPLGPNSELFSRPTLGTKEKPRRLQAFEIDGLAKGDIAIYVIGRIRYRDAFGKSRITDYRFFYGGPLGITDGAMAAYSEGNTTT